MDTPSDDAGGDTNVEQSEDQTSTGGDGGFGDDVAGADTVDAENPSSNPSDTQEGNDATGGDDASNNPPVDPDADKISGAN